MNMYIAGGSTLVTKTMARQICWHVPGEKYYRELRLIIINVYNAERNGMEAESSGSSVQDAKQVFQLLHKLCGGAKWLLDTSFAE